MSDASNPKHQELLKIIELLVILASMSIIKSVQIGVFNRRINLIKMDSGSNRPCELTLDSKKKCVMNIFTLIQKSSNGIKLNISFRDGHFAIKTGRQPHD
jgi:hypothetical protein